MVFTIVFALLGFLWLILGVNNYGFSLLRGFFQNVNWDYYSPTPLRTLSFYFSFVFSFLAYQSYRYEYLKKKNVLKTFLKIYPQIKLVFFKKIKNYKPSLSFHTLALILIVLLGLFVRVYKIPLVILYDEAATYLDYCDGGFTDLLRIWNTNNHLINTLLMKISIKAFGNNVISLRLPSLMFGFANVLLIYYISKQLYGKFTALISTFLYSCTPALIHFESLARGYSFKVTFTLLLFIACFHFLKKPNKIYLFIISFVSSLGFLTIFSFLFPFLGFLFWIIYELNNRNIEKKLIFHYTFLIALYTKIISVFLYTPSIILSNGIYNIFESSRAGNMNVYGNFPEDILKSFMDFSNMMFFNNSLLTIIFFGLSTYTFIKGSKLTSLVLSQFASAVIIVIALKSIFPSRVFIYMIPFVILLTSKLVSKIFLSLNRMKYLLLPTLQLLICLYFIEYKVLNNYHSFVDDGIKDIIKELKRLPSSSPKKSKILLKAHKGYYKSFKYYQRINNLPIIEMYSDVSDPKALDADYIVCSKANIIKNKNFTKIFDTKTFEIHKSKSFH